MKFAFAWAAGIGKTTIAHALAIELKLPFLAEDFCDYFETRQRVRACNQIGTDEAVRAAANQHNFSTAQDWLNDGARQFRVFDGFVADRWT